MEKRVEGSERYQAHLKTTTHPPEGALGMGAILVSGWLFHLQAHTGLSGEAGASGSDKRASRLAGAECAASLREPGLSTEEGHCSTLWGQGREHFPPRRVLIFSAV